MVNCWTCQWLTQKVPGLGSEDLSAYLQPLVKTDDLPVCKSENLVVAINEHRVVFSSGSVDMRRTDLVTDSIWH